MFSVAGPSASLPAPFRVSSAQTAGSSCHVSPEIPNTKPNTLHERAKKSPQESSPETAGAANETANFGRKPCYWFSASIHRTKISINHLQWSIACHPSASGHLRTLFAVAPSFWSALTHIQRLARGKSTLQRPYTERQDARGSIRPPKWISSSSCFDVDTSKERGTSI